MTAEGGKGILDMQYNKLASAIYFEEHTSLGIPVKSRSLGILGDKKPSYVGVRLALLLK